MTDSSPFIREDVQALLSLLAQSKAPPIDEQTLEQARAGYLALHTLGDRPARELAVIKNLSCRGPGGELALRLYDAREERDAGPVIAFYHGGGFVIGDLETHHNLCTEIAHQMDLPVVAVDYRRAPEHPFPAGIEDCEAATRWVAGSPEKLGRTVTGIVTIGDSAGGTASIAVAQQLAKAPADAPVILQVPIFPLAADATGTQSLTDNGEGFVLTARTIDFFAANNAPDNTDPRAIPMLGDIAATPPTVLITASLDPLRDSGRIYAAALAQHGIDHIYLEMQGTTHSFTNLRQAAPSNQADTEAIFAAMKMMLEHRSA